MYGYGNYELGQEDLQCDYPGRRERPILLANTRCLEKVLSNSPTKYNILEPPLKIPTNLVAGTPQVFDLELKSAEPAAGI